VKIWAGAASDRTGKVRLALRSSSELNEVIDDDSEDSPGNSEQVDCFSLDDLVEQEGLTQVNWLKIDAEGHEMKVLQGSDRLLQKFSPCILYENIAGTQNSNTAVAEYLQSKGYQLYRYQPYLQTLIPLQSLQDLQGNLNIIALPPNESNNEP
jgi:Methyltransferase FkbM domain